MSSVCQTENWSMKANVRRQCSTGVFSTSPMQIGANNGYCEVIKENKAQARAVTEGSWLWKSTFQKTELITFTTCTNGWNQKQIKWAKHEPHKRRLSHWAFRKGGKSYTGVDLQHLTILEKPFQLQPLDFIFPGHKGSSWTVSVLPEIQSYWLGPPTMWQFLKILVCCQLGKLIKHNEMQQHWIRRVLVGGEEPQKFCSERSSLSHLKDRVSDVMPTRKQAVRPLRHTMNPYVWGNILWVTFSRMSKMKDRTVSAPLTSQKLWVLCEQPQGHLFVTVRLLRLMTKLHFTWVTAGL